ncbi:hypothetical protein GUITHDRAFT_142217 [Guillardia theta CCMP2712]|uniref:Uncharacterized protein n=1 Tax=Guillardia theta (strain CCMP2712) TaxID=905079 RepID=L1IXN9_GUITC|nr:hypothetical protein GUITHDRAFT_142217 [Guillardia theta CCMP2712]EKX41043.1 hypothetical protein GUITHDRAFT_142217 [Guillardia theta CCMP2712]|eukprot:XP_005828023.1 hypothetical protein GUITHDRAFT_142217 [Guillardia theta CCMP2712]
MSRSIPVHVLILLAQSLPSASTSAHDTIHSRAQHDAELHMLWWLPVGGRYVNPSYPSTRVTLFSPLEGSTCPDGHFVLSYGIEKPLQGSYLRFQLDGEEMVEVGVQYVGSSTWREHKVKAEPGNHVLTVDMLAPSGSLHGEEEEELLQRLMTTFTVSSEPIYETDFEYNYMPMDVVCNGFASKNIKHRCISSISPANNLQILVRISRRAPYVHDEAEKSVGENFNLSCARVQISTVDVMQVPREAYLVVEGFDDQPVLVLNDTEKFMCEDVGRSSSLRKFTFSLVELNAIKNGDLVQDWISHRVGEEHELEVKLAADETCPDEARHGRSETPAVISQERKSAWVTIVFSEDYIFGALTLVRAIRTVCKDDEARDVLILLANHIGELLNLRTMLQQYDVKVKLIDPIYSPYNEVVRESLRAGYSKLHVWNLTEYEKTPSSSVVPIKLSLMSDSVWRAMGLPSYDGSDAGLLLSLFPDHLLYHPSLVWTDFKVAGFDFTGLPKPWQEGWLRREDPVDRVCYLPLMLEWWEDFHKLIGEVPFDEPPRLARLLGEARRG